MELRTRDCDSSDLLLKKLAEVPINLPYLTAYILTTAKLIVDGFVMLHNSTLTSNIKAAEKCTR